MSLATYIGESSQLLGSIQSANMNTTADQIVNIIATKYIIEKIVVCNPSTNLTTAVGGFYTAAAKGGTNLVANSQVYTALTGSTKFIGVTLLAILTTDILTVNPLYFALTIAQGGAATADIYIFGRILT